MFNIEFATTDALVAFASLHMDLANGFPDRLEKDYPRNMREFFPRSMAPHPDEEFAGSFGDEVLRDVVDAASAVHAAMCAREEISSRRHPN